MWEIASDMEPEDGCLWIYDTDDQQTVVFTPAPRVQTKPVTPAALSGWLRYFGRTSRFGDVHAMKGPYSSERSVALMIARELIKEIVKRDSQNRLPDDRGVSFRTMVQGGRLLRSLDRSG